MNRGTRRGKVAPETNITGEDFKDDQDKRLEESGVKTITSGRGTGTIDIEKTKTSKKKKYTGKISTGRGTGTKQD